MFLIPVFGGYGKALKYTARQDFVRAQQMFKLIGSLVVFRHLKKYDVK